MSIPGGSTCPEQATWQLGQLQLFPQRAAGPLVWGSRRQSTLAFMRRPCGCPRGAAGPCVLPYACRGAVLRLPCCRTVRSLSVLRACRKSCTCLLCRSLRLVESIAGGRRLGAAGAADAATMAGRRVAGRRAAMQPVLLLQALPYGAPFQPSLPRLHVPSTGRHCLQRQAGVRMRSLGTYLWARTPGGAHTAPPHLAQACVPQGCGPPPRAASLLLAELAELVTGWWWRRRVVSRSAQLRTQDGPAPATCGPCQPSTLPVPRKP